MSWEEEKRALEETISELNMRLASKDHDIAELHLQLEERERDLRLMHGRVSTHLFFFTKVGAGRPEDHPRGDDRLFIMKGRGVSSEQGPRHLSRNPRPECHLSWSTTPSFIVASLAELQAAKMSMDSAPQN